MPRPPLLALLAALAACAAAPTRPVLPAAPELPERRASGEAISHYLLARLASLAGDRPAALAAMRLALAHDPGSPELRVAYAETLARVGQLSLAEAEARRAVESAPPGRTAVSAHLVLAKVLSLAGVPGAQEELRAAARLEARRARAAREAGDDEPLEAEPWRVLARMRLDSGDPAGAAQACEELAELDPVEGAMALRELAGRLHDAGSTGAALVHLGRSLELDPSDAEAWKLRAKVQQERGEIAEARAAWERALVADPGDADALLAAGQLALREGDLAAARERLGRLLGSAADETGARVRMAAAWLDARQPAEALDAASGGEGDPRLAYLRGVALQQLRRWDEAAAAFREVDPSSGELYGSARVGLVHALVRAGRPAEAIRTARRGLEEHPGDVALLFALGEAYDRAGRREAALEQMRSVLAVKADHADALNYLGYSYAERGERLDEAQALLERALELEPENGYYLDSLGWTYFKKGDLERAVKALERADVLVGPEATILEHLGDTYRAARRPADAAAAYRRALEAFKEGVAEAEDASAGRASVERKLRELRRGTVPRRHRSAKP